MVRYTALTFGILYGIVHRRTLTAQERDSHARHSRTELLERARQAWEDKNSPGASSCSSSLSAYVSPGSEAQIYSVAVITDPDDPKFDLEALVAAYEKH